ncbi:ubiquitin fusion degradation protein UFD1-domain-containing protein [Cladorrhinum samala]|uniref:Ubiquitin fusion degradation protein UFD1-domain-containing protein n=1 Tax=Cladorrhinum samala TaxID=585594 RepID=A0AAV9H8U3_9PEZI|nr:ubiquitin fusion degradation protein UFD1-domain-containing protein [Cladorrhinum samala]
MADGDQPLVQLNWSAALRVAYPSSVASKGLQGDKILLPQSALEQLLSASASASAGPSTSHTFTAFDRFNPYSTTDVRRDNSQYKDNYQQLPHPLMFQLVNQRNGNTVYAGIREFSANEDEVALSHFLLDALGIKEEEIQDAKQAPTDDAEIDPNADEDIVPEKDGLRITVKARQLPKGSYVRLRPLEAGYNPDDWKSLLERQLRASFTTLTRDSVLTVRGVKGEEFQFLVDKLQPDGNGICVVDTDIEVDIEPLNEEQAKETMRQIAARAQTSSGGAIDIWKSAEGQVLRGDYVDYELPSWDKARPLVIELTIHGGQELDLFVNPRSNRHRVPPRADEHVFGDFSSPKDGIKSIIIQPTNSDLQGAEALLISVHGFLLPADQAGSVPERYTLRARALEAPDLATTTGDADPTSAPLSVDDVQCKNCLQIVPKRTLMLHENFCLRNNIVCPQCKLVFQKRSTDWEDHWHCATHPDAFGSTSISKAKHDYVQHSPHTCHACGPSTPFTFPSLPELSLHRTTVCPHKVILCQFCHLEVPQEGDPLDPSSEAETALSGLTAHERADGARTTDCHLCGAIVRLRDMAAHTAHHELDKVGRAPPEVCRDELCGRTLHGIGPRGQVNGGTRMGQGPGNDLGLCSLCYAPLYASTHDPEGKALRRRIERRYLTQLMTGCGKKWCQNEWCKAGRANLGLESRGTSAATALPLVKPLLETIKDNTTPMHFCVDEASQRRRKTAEMLAAEGVWSVEWCIAAMEAEGGNLNKARGWLVDWAPSKVAR